MGSGAESHIIPSRYVRRQVYFVQTLWAEFSTVVPYLYSLSTVTACRHKNQAENSVVSLNHFLWCSLMFGVSRLIPCFHTNCCAQRDTMESCAVHSGYADALSKVICWIKLTIQDKQKNIYIKNIYIYKNANTERFYGWRTDHLQYGLVCVLIKHSGQAGGTVV